MKCHETICTSDIEVLSVISTEYDGSTLFQVVALFFIAEMVHNHPSGDPTPSPQDIQTTNQVVEAAKALGISIHDHIIIGRKAHASFKALGLL